MGALQNSDFPSDYSDETGAVNIKNGLMPKKLTTLLKILPLLKFLVVQSSRSLYKHPKSDMAK